MHCMCRSKNLFFSLLPLSIHFLLIWIHGFGMELEHFFHVIVCQTVEIYRQTCHSSKYELERGVLCRLLHMHIKRYTPELDVRCWFFIVYLLPTCTDVLYVYTISGRFSSQEPLLPVKTLFSMWMRVWLNCSTSPLRCEPVADSQLLHQMAVQLVLELTALIHCQNCWYAHEEKYLHREEKYYV